jgi:hypothetical protein
VRQPLRHNLTAAQAVKAMRRRLGKADEHHAAVADAIRFALRKILGTIGIAQYEAPRPRADLDRHVLGDREKELVAMGAIVPLFCAARKSATKDFSQTCFRY